MGSPFDEKRPRPADPSGGPGGALDVRWAKALAHPLRVHILTAAHGRVLSPAEFARESGEPLGKVAGHFKRLVEYGALEPVGERQVRGAVEHFYTGSRRAIFTAADWQSLPESVEAGVAGAALQDFVATTVRAIQSGSFTARADVVFAWDELRLDEQGMEALIGVLNRVWEQVPELEEEAAARMEASGEQPIRAVVGLAGYEAPRGDAPTRAEGEGPAKD